MRILAPSISELHAFATAARRGTFAAAAAELHVTEGAISRAITRLQEHLGTALFVREGRRNVLSPAGLAYLQAIDPALQSIEAATLVARQTARPRQQGLALRLSVTPTFFSHWLIPRLPEFAALHPQISLSYAPYQRDDPLTAPDIDAWIRGGAPPWPAAVHADYVVGRELVPICRPADLEGPQGLRTPADLLQRPLLFHTHHPDNWAYWLKAVGCPHPPPSPSADFEQVAMLVQAVIAGLGVAVVQRCLVEADLAAGRIALAVEHPVQLDRGYYLCRPAARGEPPALESFRAWLLSQV